ncbi:MAG: hypothetical protein PF541_07585 [Prolixibacteraceae bacterium]|nr:hypothetical protein [Prolixibacteraceae bacterium]
MKQFETIKIAINQNEQKALNHKFAHFKSGDEFVDPHHMNSYDLDLFGEGSMFQFLNRTVTPKGKSKLASTLQKPILDSVELEKHQELIKELALKLNWRHNFSANGQMYAEDELENNLFQDWENQQFTLRTLKMTKWLVVVLPLIGILSILFWIFIGNSIIFTLSVVLQLVLWYTESQNIKVIYSQFGKRVKLLQKYGILLKYIEDENWHSVLGKQKVNQLRENGLPSEEIEKLKKIISVFDNRNNFIFGIILNLVFLWDIWCSFRLIKWHNRNQQNYGMWMDVISFFDANNSLANYAYNHPDYCYPEFSTGQFEFKSVQMGHPLIQPKKMVSNDFELAGLQQTIIVTGANMSGKSTFLRTLGVNMVIGMSGAPVCARKLTFKPIEVFSNMRTTDSLFDDESYFFAELKRLQSILEEVDKGRELLIILDEILKGTNSVDKLYGSQKLVQRLIHQNTTAIIATHDLKLTEIEKDFPNKVQNKCFEITIDNDEMKFDYHLRNGITTVMNATFLMKKMWIIK